MTGAALLFATDLKTRQDFHGATNNNTFESWMKNQLIPGIRDLGPSVIVMDNAPYHSQEAETCTLRVPVFRPAERGHKFPCGMSGRVGGDGIHCTAQRYVT